MSHGADAALLEDVVPSRWTAISVVGAPVELHRARRYARLLPDVPERLTFPLFLSPEATRIQIDIASAWPAVISVDDASVSYGGTSPFVRVGSDRIEIFNGDRLRAAPGTNVLCVAGVLTMQLTEIDPTAFGPGARLRLSVRRAPVVPLSAGDPLLAEVARPERAVRDAVAALRARAEALAR